MNMPGFTAQASLSRTMGKYQGNAVFSNSRANEVLPMQGFAAAALETHNLVWRPFEKLAWCCSDWHGRPLCAYYYVPVWYDCDVTYTPYACMFCHPPVLHL
jgi:hypothetical protein